MPVLYNVSDNTVDMGSIIGKNAVLGSNSVCPAYRYLKASIWFTLVHAVAKPVMLDKVLCTKG
jgi:hypothetical protein